MLVKVLASSVNRLDVMQAKGTYPIPPGVTSVGGMDVAGYIVDPNTLEVLLEEGSTQPKLCFGLASGGAYAEYVSMQKDHLINLPADFNS